MRKKSPAVQKWVNSIAEEDCEHSTTNEPAQNQPNCDKIDLSTDEPSTSQTSGNIKVKFNEICAEKSELKNLITKPTCKIKRESVEHHFMEHNIDETKSENSPVLHEFDRHSRFGTFSRSSSESPSTVITRSRHRLNDIGRSFSLANDNELPNIKLSSENIEYDADDTNVDSVLSSFTNVSNSQLTPTSTIFLRSRSLREHTVSEGHSSPQTQMKNPLLRDSSFQSDSSCSSKSVESLLEARKPDAEAILLGLGFGPPVSDFSKIPKRFLKPSQVKGVDTFAFLRNQHLSNNIVENSVLGYRGLMGNSPKPSQVVKAIIGRFSANEFQRMESIDYNSPRLNFRGVAQCALLAQRQFMK